MLHVLLFILKILGIILLAILGLILAGVLLALFVLGAVPGGWKLL